jgi:nitroreductase
VEVEGQESAPGTAAQPAR